MAFSPAFLDELRARINLSDVVGRRVRLIKRGREHTGLCPFHNEKSPSFTVSDDKGFFHCFGCGAHGDVVGFVMKTENLTFLEAVERLAEEAGMPIPKSAPEDKARAKVELSLFAVTEAACKWFEERLKAPEGRAARDYLIRRGVDAAGGQMASLGADRVAAQAQVRSVLVRPAIQRADDGHFVHHLRQARQMFADVDTRDIGGNGLKGSANFLGRIDLQVVHVLMRRRADQVNHDHGLGALAPRNTLGREQLIQRQPTQGQRTQFENISTGATITEPSF